MNPEFVGAVRLKKLLASKFESSGVKEKGLRLVSSVLVGGIVKESGEPVLMVCDDTASWSSINGRMVKCPFTCGCLF